MNPSRLLICHGDKCKLEGKRHPAKDMLQFTPSGKHFCQSCFEATRRERVEQKKLEETICRIFRIAKPSPMMLAQIKNQRNKDITTKNIRLSLEYFYDVKGNSIHNSKGIGIVPYIVDEMKSYHLQRLAKRQENAVELQSFEGRKITRIKMAPPKRRYDYKQEMTINLEELANAIRKQ